ncbi:MAG: hypothetical protein GX221_08465 [Candidatus Riflebacteria bacterium]|nr:hypothetical protein [Candidatus Riflebacteria bacterium]
MNNEKINKKYSYAIFAFLLLLLIFFSLYICSVGKEIAILINRPYQATLAAESAVNYFSALIQTKLEKSSNGNFHENLHDILASLPRNEYISLADGTDAEFMLVRATANERREDFSAAKGVAVIKLAVEGRSRSASVSGIGVLQLNDLAESFVQYKAFDERYPESGKSSLNSLENKNRSDSDIYFPAYSPNFSWLKKLAQTEGIYLNTAGEIFLKGKKVEAACTVRKMTLYSDAYKTDTSPSFVQELLKEEHIITLHDVFAAIPSQLAFPEIIYSENSLAARGSMPASLVLATPRRFFITGSLNPEADKSLMILADAGISLLDTDLAYLADTSEDIGEAANWRINGVFYGAGAGVFSLKNMTAPPDGVLSEHVFRNRYAGESIGLEIGGSCISGDLRRWIANTGEHKFKLIHKPYMSSRLQIKPWSLAITDLYTSFDN